MIDRPPIAETPIAVGGVGGSGTRVFANLLQRLGYHIGNDLNRPLDDLLFTFLFKRKELFDADIKEIQQLWRIFVCANTGQNIELDSHLVDRLCVTRVGHHDGRWLRKRLANLINNSAKSNFSGDHRWGWKEPNTLIFAERLLQICPSLIYIHVVRDGRDMAFSKNQNQLRLWGDALLNEATSVTADWSLKYWCRVHKNMLNLKRQFPDRVLMVCYEQMCRQPRVVSQHIVKFCGLKARQNLDDFYETVDTPDSIDRWRTAGIEMLDPTRVEFASHVRAAITLPSRNS